MKKTIFALLLFPLLSLAQGTTTAAETNTEGGMKFEHGLSWAQIQAKAKTENKYIIMDCFTTWCGPCKFMDANIFPLKETGDFFNASYLNVKVQFDSTANDNEEVKSWKKDMKEIEKQYTINAYPTYLIFDPNGQIVHRVVGSTKEAKDFIARGKDGMVPETQYYTQLRNYEGGKNEPEFLKKLALMAQAAFDSKNAAKIGNEYIATISDPYQKENLEFIDKFSSKSKDRGFAMMLENPEKVDAILGKGKSEAKVKGIIFSENVVPVLNAGLKKENPVVPDFDALTEKLSKTYPAYGPEIASKAKVVYYQNKKDWNNFQTEVVAYMTKYGDKANVNELNTYAWTVFENCKDMSCVTQALDWSKRSFAENQNPTFMDTYANILYKMGKKTEAIDWEKKALAKVSDAEKKTYQETLDKMEKGEKTWKD